MKQKALKKGIVILFICLGFLELIYVIVQNQIPQIFHYVMMTINLSIAILLGTNFEKW